MYIPRWVHRLMVEERVRTRILPPRKGYSCPVGLVDSSDFVLVSRNPLTVACAEYERKRGSDMPSKEQCPNCPYNTDKIRKNADERLNNAISSFLKN